MPPPVVMKRIGIAILIAVAIYAAMLAFGSALYATGVIGHGATHNDCVNFRADIAEQRGIAEEDVPSPPGAPSQSSGLTEAQPPLKSSATR